MTRFDRFSIDDYPYTMDSLRATLRQCREHDWVRTEWKCKDAWQQGPLLSPEPPEGAEGGRILLFEDDSKDEGDTNEPRLIPGGWDHDHCWLCLWDLCECCGPEHAVGYTDGSNWICEGCYARFLAPEAAYGYLADDDADGPCGDAGLPSHETPGSEP